MTNPPNDNRRTSVKSNHNVKFQFGRSTKYCEKMKNRQILMINDKNSDLEHYKILIFFVVNDERQINVKSL